jgi:flagellar motor switch protein FliN
LNLSNIFKKETQVTLEQLLSLQDVISEIETLKLDIVSPNDTFIEVNTMFSYSTFNISLVILIPQTQAYIIENKMLGEVDEPKVSVDDDLLDAIKELTSNITGAIANSINAQGDESLDGVKFSTENAIEKKDVDTSKFNSLLKINLTSSTDEFNIYFLLDTQLEHFFKDDDDIDEEDINIENDDNLSVNKSNDPKASMLNDSEMENLKLLMNIELNLSVRLGTTEMLLKDIVKLDLGDIVELDQLIDEPLDILVNGTKIAEGEAVVVNGKFAVKIKNVGSVKERLSYLRVGN